MQSPTTGAIVPSVWEMPMAEVPETKPEAEAPKKRRKDKEVHQVLFTTYPKLLFTWPVIVAGILFFPLAYALEPADQPAEEAAATTAEAPPDAADAEEALSSAGAEEQITSREWWLGFLGWIYIWILILVILTLGVDIDRNQVAFWVIFVVAVWILGQWLQDVRGFTFFGDIYNWFESLRVQYDRSLGLALSVLLLVPFVVMLGWARINNRWRITHNEFEHYSFGKMDDSLGRGAKTIRTSFPDVFELLLGLAGTLIVYNATGTKELRRIPHVMFLPLVRKRLNLILERTAITTAQIEDSDEEDDEV